MGMILASKTLLEDKIIELESKSTLSSGEKMALSYCQKELEIIKMLQIKNIDFIGTSEEFKEKIKNKEIYFLDKEEYRQLSEKAKKYDMIVAIANNGKRGQACN